jgi:hypothetical protein
MKLIKQNGKAILTENLYKKLIQELANIKLKKKINESVILKLLVEEDLSDYVPEEEDQVVEVEPYTEDRETAEAIADTIFKATDNKELAGLTGLLAWKGTQNYARGLVLFEDLMKESKGVFNVASYLQNNLSEILGGLTQPIIGKGGTTDIEALDAVATVLAFIAADKTKEKFWVRMLGTIIAEGYKTWPEFLAGIGIEMVAEGVITTVLTGNPIGFAAPLAKTAVEDTAESVGTKFFKETTEELAKQSGTAFQTATSSAIKSFPGDVGISAPGIGAKFSRGKSGVGKLKLKDVIDTRKQSKIAGKLIFDQTFDITQKGVIQTAEEMLDRIKKEIADEIANSSTTDARKKILQSALSSLDNQQVKNNILKQFKKYAQNLIDARSGVFKKLDLDRAAFSSIQKSTGTIRNKVFLSMQRLYNSPAIIKMERALRDGNIGLLDGIKIIFNFTFGKKLPKKLEDSLKSGIAGEMNVGDMVLDELDNAITDFVNDNFEDLVKAGLSQKDSFVGMALKLTKESLGQQAESKYKEMAKDILRFTLLYNGAEQISFKNYWLRTSLSFLAGGKTLPREIRDALIDQSGLATQGPLGLTEPTDPKFKRKKQLQIMLLTDPDKADTLIKDWIAEHTRDERNDASVALDINAGKLDPVRKLLKQDIEKEADDILTALKGAFEDAGIGDQITFSNAPTLADIRAELMRRGSSSSEKSELEKAFPDATFNPAFPLLGLMQGNIMKFTNFALNLIDDGVKSFLHTFTNPSMWFQRDGIWPFALKTERMFENLFRNDLEDMADMFEEVYFSGLMDTKTQAVFSETDLNDLLDLAAEIIRESVKAPKKISSYLKDGGNYQPLNAQGDTSKILSRINSALNNASKTEKFSTILIKKYTDLKSDFNLDFNNLNKEYLDAMQAISGWTTENSSGLEENIMIDNKKLLLKEIEFRSFVNSILKKKDALLTEASVTIKPDDAELLTKHFMRKKYHLVLNNSLKYKKFEKKHQLVMLTADPGQSANKLQNFPNSLFTLEGDNENFKEHYFVLVVFYETGLNISRTKLLANKFVQKGPYAYDITDAVDNYVEFDDKNLHKKSNDPDPFKYDKIIATGFKQSLVRENENIKQWIADQNQNLINARGSIIASIENLIPDRDEKFQIPVLYLGYSKDIKTLVASEEPNRQSLLGALAKANQNRNPYSIIDISNKDTFKSIIEVSLDQNSSIVNAMKNRNKEIVQNNPAENKADNMILNISKKKEERKSKTEERLRIATGEEEESIDEPRIKFLQDSGVMSRDNPPKWLGKDGFNSNVTLTSQKSKANMTLWAQIYTLFCLHKFVESGAIAQSDVSKLELYKKGWTKYTGSGGALDFKFTEVEMNLAFELVTRAAKKRRLGPYADQKMPVFEGESLVDFYSKIKNNVPEYVGYHGSQTFAGVAAIARDIFLEYKPGSSGSDAKTNFIVRENKINMSQNNLRETIKKILKSKS